MLSRNTPSETESDPVLSDSDWHCVTTVEELKQVQPLVVRPARRQIALFMQGDRILACDNRCPHEGYPLSQGHLGSRCVLTCNWHNWKFDLRTGDNLLGGDKLRVYRTCINSGKVWICLKDPSVSERITSTLENLKSAFVDNSYDRISRELVRLHFLGADPMDTLRHVVLWSYDRLEFGFTHAYAGMADWLRLYHESAGDDEDQLACLQETVSHVSFDVLRQPCFPYSGKRRHFTDTEFLEAIEQENEEDATSLLLGGLDSGMHFPDFEPALTRAALAHYNDFGHSLIYVNKTARLVERLGTGVEFPLLLCLVRSLIYATREDKIPEFRHYHAALKNWKDKGETEPRPELWHGKGIKSALDTTLSCGQHPPLEIFRSMLLACATSLSGYDTDHQLRAHVPIADNVNGLDFSHALTFANAVHLQCGKFPELWPNGLLQIACFLGRNAAYSNPDTDCAEWDTEDIDSGLDRLRDKVIDHGANEPIVAVHLLKTFCSVREEMQNLQDQSRHILFAALNRFLCTPLKRRHTLRTAYQSIRFIKDEI